MPDAKNDSAMALAEAELRAAKKKSAVWAAFSASSPGAMEAPSGEEVGRMRQPRLLRI